MYGKFFASTFTGSMFGAGPAVFAVWGYIVANVRVSTIELNPQLLAAILGTDVATVSGAIEKLSEPDAHSRNPAQQGRRIVHEHGFQYRVTSHEIYRQIRNEDDRRAYNRAAQVKSRAKKRAAGGVVSKKNNQKHSEKAKSNGLSLTCQPMSALSAHTEAEAEAEAEAKRETETRAAARVSLSPAAPFQASDPKRDPFTDATITERAGRFIERYAELYPQQRLGARYAVRPVRDYAAAVTLCQTWTDDARLDNLAIVFLGCDHKFAEEGSRTIPQFLALASWCDGKLSEYEATKRAAK